MSVFVDTSAIYALLSSGDDNHEAAARIFEDLLDADVLVTNNYVLVESTSLVHARHGRAPLRHLRALTDAFECIWVDEETHAAAHDRLLGRGRQGPSFVDLVTFETMRRNGVESAFAFDDDFVAEGFALVPPAADDG